MGAKTMGWETTVGRKSKATSDWADAAQKPENMDPVITVSNRRMIVTRWQLAVVSHGTTTVITECLNGSPVICESSKIDI